MSIQESLGAGSGNLLNSIVAAMAARHQDKAVKKMDTDGSGGVDKSEFQAALDKVSGKYGIELGAEADKLFTASDANADGVLDASEVGKAIQNLFAPASGPGTQAFVQNRGDEARFAELDLDGDGQISRAEFGIGEGMVVSTTTVTTTTVIQSGTDGVGLSPDTLAALVGNGGGTISANPAPVMAAWQPAPADSAALTAAADTTQAVADPAAAASPAGALQGDSLQALLQQADADGDGQISGSELSALVAQLSAQMEAASRRYNDVALARSGLAAGTDPLLSATA